MGRLETTDWFNTWCEPVVVALYERDPGRVLASLTAAYHAQETALMSDEHRACLRVQLTFLEFQSQTVLKYEDWTELKLPLLLGRLAEPTDFTSAERLRRRLYIQMRIHLDAKGIKPLIPPEFDELYNELPESEHVTEVWFHISNWAFHHRQTFYLEKAYEFALLQAKGFNETWTWQRIHLMLKLVRGDARREDVIWLIDQAEIPKHLANIRRVLWPRAVELGLVDSNVEMRMEVRELELKTHSKQQLKTHLQPHLINRRQASNN